MNFIHQLLITILLLPLVSSCYKKDMHAPIIPMVTPIAPIATDTSKTYLALGDSYTIGQNVAEAERFPAQTLNILKSLNINIKQPKYIATTGWRTSDLLNAINQQNLKDTFNVVTLLIGVNDQYNNIDTAIYRQNFTIALQKSIGFAGGKATHVFVLSIPDYSVTPYVTASEKARVSMEIDWFNTINKQIATAYNTQYLNITNASRGMGTNPALITPDGLHPSGLEYKIWAEMLAPVMKPVLQ